MSSSSAAGALPRRARVARKARGWTQQEAADRVGISVRSYQLFENGQSTPQPANLQSIVEVFGLEQDAGSDESQWEPDIQAFLNMIGVYMEGLSDRERERFILTETRRIFQQMRATSTGERDEAAEAMREALARHAPSETQDIPRESRRNA